jgi:PAS domain S-box-containing protein
MNTLNMKTQKKPNLKKYALALIVGWTLILGASLLWNVYHVKKETLEAAGIQARVAYDKDLLYRRWNANHGGVYVFVTEKTKPNPYLINIPEREITTPSGKLLTLINPAYMTRQVYELEAEISDIRGHLTSLKPLKSENAPDDWERKALESFEQGEKEIASIDSIEGREYYRYMGPFITEKGCLRCHAIQGYKEGDIRGGISISIPMIPLWNISSASIQRLKLIHGLIWLIGLGGLAIGYVRVEKSERRRIKAEKELQTAYADVEKRVKERTHELKIEVEERVLAEKSAQELATQWQTTMDAVGDAMCILDTGNKILRSNKLMGELFGKKESELMGKHCWEVVHGTKTPLPECPVLRMKETLKRESIELSIGDRWYDIAVDPLLNEQGILTGAVHIIRDNTERKLAGEKIGLQLTELRRWQNVMLDREDRVIELKKEVNELLKQLGKQEKYHSDTKNT